MKLVRVFALILVLCCVFSCRMRNKHKLAGYVERDKCMACHEEEMELHKDSHHDLAMEEAIPEYVLGDFSGVTFIYGSDTACFFREDNSFKVRTLNSHGEPEVFTINYTFGWTPLQQYLIEFPGGKYQVLPYCWDSRPKEEGGQRWYHIYSGEVVTHTDPLFWTGKYQNWNHVCAECHSTNFKKNYNSKKLQYESSWSEIDVSCDACHGPSKNHLKWAKRNEKGRSVHRYPNMGYGFKFASRDSVRWIFNMEKGTAFPEGGTEGTSEIEICARCHSRRHQIWDDYVHGELFLQTHIPEVLEPHLYYHDGQIKDEVYVYGSFLQSKMYKQGVSCTDCHDPHSMKVQAPGNVLCAKCHVFTKYNNREHHFHDPDSTGGNCMECHMPRTTYMGVDRRLDHSIRIPRPDLSDKIGSPNACIQCHTEESNDWANQWFRKWYGNKYDTISHYGMVFYEASQYQPQAFNKLLDIAWDTAYNEIVRATAVRYMENYPSKQTLDYLKEITTCSYPMIRMVAIRLLGRMNAEYAVESIGRLLSDSIRSVRYEAVQTLSRIPAIANNTLPNNTQKEAIHEHLEMLKTNSDQAASYINLGLMCQSKNKLDSAELYYRKALAIDSLSMEASINLADVYRLQGEDGKAFPILKDQIRLHPYRAEAYQAMGMWYTRQKQPQKALEMFQKTVEMEPENTYYLYVYSVALHSMGRKRHAKTILHEAYKINPYDYNILYMLSAVYQEIGDIKQYERFYGELENLTR